MILKKILAFLSSVTFLASCSLMSVNALSKGDANSDGKVNVRDCAHIAKSLAQGSASSLPSAADYNNDNTINVRDAAKLASNIANGTAGDKLILPYNVNVYDSTFNSYLLCEYITSHSYDIDQDGIKETIGQYSISSNSTGFTAHPLYYYSIYDNGEFVAEYYESIPFGNSPYLGIVYDKNKNSYNFAMFESTAGGCGFLYYLYPGNKHILTYDPFMESTLYGKITTNETVNTYFNNVIPLTGNTQFFNYTFK